MILDIVILLTSTSNDSCSSHLTHESNTRNYMNVRLIDPCNKYDLVIYINPTSIFYMCIFIRLTFKYILLQGYKRRHEFIITQMPLSTTKADFWRLVEEHDVHTIVMMKNLSKVQVRVQLEILTKTMYKNKYTLFQNVL